jgi:periplasmic protein TonB
LSDSAGQIEAHRGSQIARPAPVVLGERADELRSLARYLLTLLAALVLATSVHVLAYFAVLAAVRWMPVEPVSPPSEIAIEVQPLEPEPEPAPPAVQPVVQQAALVEPPRVRRRAEPPPPPLPVVTTERQNAGADFAQPAGDPDGRIGGVPNGTGTGEAAIEGESDTPGEVPAISREALRALLVDYIRGTLSRYLDGRIDYPLAARREHVEGVVMLRIRLARDGRILAVRLSQESGSDMLDDAALASVRGLVTMPAPPATIPWDDRRELPLPVTYVLE